jgi:hypothetical protein
MKYRRVRMALNNLIPLRTEKGINQARLSNESGGCARALLLVPLQDGRI